VGHVQPVTRIHARGLPWREPGRGLESTREDCAGEEHARDLGAGGLCCSGIARRDSRWAVRRGGGGACDPSAEGNRRRFGLRGTLNRANQ
jgi:hypothetical protein